MMYKRVPVQIAVVAFPNSNTAASAAGNLATTLALKGVTCANLVIVKKDEDSKVTIKEYGKDGPFNGFIVGGTSGTFVGAAVGGIALSLLGPIGMAAGGSVGAIAGGAIGALNGTITGTAKAVMVESVDKEKIQLLGSCLTPNSSALVAVFEEVVMTKSELKKKHSDKLKEVDEVTKLAAETISSALKQDQFVGVGLDVDDEGILLSRTIVSDDKINIGTFMLTPELEECLVSTVSINKDGEASEKDLVTDEGGVFLGGVLVQEDALLYEVGAVDPDSEKVSIRKTPEIGGGAAAAKPVSPEPRDGAQKGAHEVSC
ncbi:expressed unknown protein [Seminavis robusta]|uniref:Uncharacterized protein n=1 Tax=Seminavis robusta TaxID=568900 RepID=A0A9N8ETI4_9STRA|nr:expressed unknown protein [Seminavis robusta]|eukprot:Sro1650_g288670.1 n/a (316) ;mRNA; f:3936-4883